MEAENPDPLVHKVDCVRFYVQTSMLVLSSTVTTSATGYSGVRTRRLGSLCLKRTRR